MVMILRFCVVFLLGALVGLAPVLNAQQPVRVTVDTRSPGAAVPDDFVGMSFETGSLPPGTHGIPGYFFDAANKDLVWAFRALGIRNLRVGGGSVDSSSINPTREQIDRLFGFADAADVQVVYSVRMLNGDPAEASEIAAYIWQHHRQRLECFSIGNEPDWHSFHVRDPAIFETEEGRAGSAYPSYIKRWREFADAIAKAAPGARFGGPNTGSNFPVEGTKDTTFEGRTWTANFVRDMRERSDVAAIYLHNYVGQDVDPQTGYRMVDMMLSPEWVELRYPALYEASAAPVLAAGGNYRLMESNSFSGGLAGGSDTFATALFALDYLHWWARHHSRGVNFHNKQWLFNNTIYHTAAGGYRINPMGYGIKAFGLGSQGRIVPTALANPDHLNVTAYAVMQEGVVRLTLINKEHGANRRNAEVHVVMDQAVESRQRLLRLEAGDGDVASTGVVTLGGAQLRVGEAWSGRWTTGPVSDPAVSVVSVPAGSAVIVELTLRPSSSS